MRKWGIVYVFRVRLGEKAGGIEEGWRVEIGEGDVVEVYG